jgi:acetyl esterase
MRSPLLCLALLAFAAPVAFVAPVALAAATPAATVTSAIPYVTRPSGPLLLDASVPDGPGPFPAVLIVHGGGFVRGSRITYVPPIFQPLTAAGFAWFTIDYRLAPQATVQDQIADVRSALTWIHTHTSDYKLDPHRIVLLGESAGAYLVDYIAMTAPSDIPIAAVVSFYSPADLTFNNAVTTMPAAMRTFFGADAPHAEATLRSLSPYAMVKPNLPPFLLLHGAADEQVPYAQSPRFCEALKAKGNTCELFTVPNGRHGMGQWEENAGQLAYKQKVITWLKQTLH